MAEIPHPTTPAANADTSPDPDALLDFEGIRKLLNMGRQATWQLCNRGEIPAFRIGRVWRARRSALISWIESRERKAVRR